MKRSWTSMVLVVVALPAWISAAFAQPEASLHKCQQTAGKEFGKAAAGWHKAVTKCLNKISAERIKDATGSAAGAADACIAAFRKLINSEDVFKQLEAKIAIKILKACDPLLNPDLQHTEDDVVDADGAGLITVIGDAIHAERLGIPCRVGGLLNGGSGTAGRLGSINEWFICQVVAARAGALRQIHLEYPQGDFWLRDVRPVIDTLATGGDVGAQDALQVLDFARRWVDNQDGTVTDRVTGLMWEVKTDDSSFHDKDNTYTWSTGTNNPDGTAFTSFLFFVNGGATAGVGNCSSADGIIHAGFGFAGHCDWRLPTMAELQTILLEPSLCSTNPCIDPTIFGPTQSGHYWSSTTLTSSSNWAWFVTFDDGGVSQNPKTVNNYVRAVRGGGL